MECEIKCEHCNRYIGKAYGSIIASIRCPNSSCKADNHIKIINSDQVADIKHKWLEAPQPPKKKQVEVS